MKTNRQPLSIYIHIPFCIKKCLYCDFLSAPASCEEQKDYVRALVCEIRDFQTVSKIQTYEVISVFFGGGTPSLLEVSWMGDIMDALKETFFFSEDVEISLECNPKTATFEKLQGFFQAGVNRLSIGLQSADEKELQLLGRLHNYEEFLDTFQMARKVGFDNINIDIMSALPGQTIASYEATLKKVLQLKPEHISAYSLIVEEGTPFYEMYGANKPVCQTIAELPDEDTEREMYYLTKRMLYDAGYERYEISNYAKKGFACRHNLTYWTGIDYVGFGIGAASYINGVRYKCISDRRNYLYAGMDERYEEIIHLSVQEKMEEFMYLGLRLIGGVSEAEFQKRFQVEIDEIYGDVIAKMTVQGLLERKEQLRLTEKGLDVANYVMAEFLL